MITLKLQVNHVHQLCQRVHGVNKIFKLEEEKKKGGGGFLPFPAMVISRLQQKSADGYGFKTRTKDIT